MNGGARAGTFDAVRFVEWNSRNHHVVPVIGKTFSACLPRLLRSNIGPVQETHESCKVWCTEPRNYWKPRASNHPDPVCRSSYWAGPHAHTRVTYQFKTDCSS
jgi:hypothetical protein